MRIYFDKLETTSDTIQVSWDGGNTWDSYPVISARENGITFTEADCSDFSLIKIKGKFLTSADIDFVATAKEDSSTSAGSISIIDENGVCVGLCGDLIIPKVATSIGDWAFYNCRSLTSVNIPDGVTSIGREAFYNCTGLTSVTIPDSVTSIGIWAFSRCSSLTNITIPNSVTSIGDNAFDYCSKLKSVVIPNGVISIGNCAFDYCSGLTNITISDSVTSIGDNAFRNCTGLTSVTIPDSVVSIGNCAFGVCTNLTSITIPDSVTSIGNAFYGCSKLTTINYMGTQEQWDAISKKSDWNGRVPSNCVINYNYIPE